MEQMHTEFRRVDSWYVMYLNLLIFLVRAFKNIH